MKTKKNLLALILIVSFSLMASNLLARGRGDSQERRSGYNKSSQMKRGPIGFLNKMQEELGLSDQQVEEIYKVSSEYRDKIFQNRKNLEEVKKLREEKRKAVKQILTDEQKEKFEDFNKRRRFMKRSRWHGRKSENRPLDCPYAPEK